MISPHKDSLAKWLPVVIALLGNAVLFGVFYGRTTNELVNIRADIMPMEKRLEIFYTRREANTLETLIRDTNAKVDVLYQRELAK